MASSEGDQVVEEQPVDGDDLPLKAVDVLDEAGVLGFGDGVDHGCVPLNKNIAQSG